MEKEQTLFRKKIIDRISSPEQLTDYLRVTEPGIWVVLFAVIMFLVGLFVYAGIGTLETVKPVKVSVIDNSAIVIMTENESIVADMPLRVEDVETVITATDTDEYGRTFGYAEVELKGGIYDGELVVEQTHPIEFLFDNN